MNRFGLLRALRRKETLSLWCKSVRLVVTNHVTRRALSSACAATAGGRAARAPCGGAARVARRVSPRACLEAGPLRVSVYLEAGSRLSIRFGLGTVHKRTRARTVCQCRTLSISPLFDHSSPPTLSTTSSCRSINRVPDADRSAGSRSRVAAARRASRASRAWRRAPRARPARRRARRSRRRACRLDRRHAICVFPVFASATPVYIRFSSIPDLDLGKTGPNDEARVLCVSVEKHSPSPKVL